MSRYLIIAPLSLFVVMVLYLVMHGLLNQQQTIEFKENESELIFLPFAVDEIFRTTYCGGGRRLYRKPLTKAELWKETYKVIFSTLSSACFSSPYENLRLSTPNIQHISQGILKELIPNDPFVVSEYNQTKPHYNQKLALSWLPPVQYPPHTRVSEGWVELEILVNAQGTVDDIHVIAANPPRVFDRTAIRAYKKAKYLPEMVNGKAIAKTTIQRINFKLAGN